MDYKTTIAWIFVMLIITLIIFRYIYLNTLLPSTECKNVSKIPKATKLSSNQTSYNFFDYYYKSCYNACNSGGTEGTYVSMCALDSALDGGFRFLDFAIFNINEQPVVASSNLSSFDEKETFNSIPFIDVLKNISNKAFTILEDPIIIHLRIMSNSNDMLNNLASQISIYSHLFLSPEFSYVNGGKNIGYTPILELKNKIILIVNRNTDTVDTNTQLNEYINLFSSSLNCRLLSYQSVAFTPSMDELIDYNKTGITICFPDSPTVAPKLSVVNSMGVQMCCFGLGSDLNEQQAFFEKAGSACVLKPENLRFKPTTIATPTPQKPKLSYQPREIKSQYYNFKI